MKKLLSYSLLATLLLLGACRKSDNPKIPTLARVPVPTVKVDPTGDVSISATNPTSFSGKFTVGLFFPTDIKPSKMDVVARKNGGTPKIFSAGLTTWPTTFTVTGAQITALFGATPVLGDQYDFSVDVYTQDGTKYEAWPAVGVGYGAGVAGEYGGVSLVASYGVLCKFTLSEWQGKNYQVIVDDWADYVPLPQPIPVTFIDATHFSTTYVTDVNNKAFVVTINADNSLTVPKQPFGAYSGTPYGTWFAQTTTVGINTIQPCDGIINLNLLLTSDGGYTGGQNILKIKRL